MFEPCDVVERMGHFNGIIPSLACILTKQNGVRGGKFLLKTPGNAISETLNFKMSLDTSALKNLCLWCEFQSHLLFIISLLLKTFLTALLFRSCSFKCYRAACTLTWVYRNFGTANLSGSLRRIEHLNMSAPILCCFTAGQNNSGYPYPSIRMKLAPDWSLTCEYYMFAPQFACLFLCLLFFPYWRHCLHCL